jgi:predicted RNA-binding Zn ribbon-like protein
MIVDERLCSDNFSVMGGRLCLAFANTVHYYGGEDPRDELAAYADLVSWCKRAGVITEGEMRHLGREAQRRLHEAAEIFNKAIELRGSIYRVFSAVADGRQPAKADLLILNASVSEALAWLQIITTPKGFIWSWKEDKDNIARILWPVARSSAELLTSDQLNRLRECSGNNCTWLFMDTSKNQSRKWCSMSGCGNRAKSHRHYNRVRFTS